jgi:AraC family ethanolamine operon transcriptional activator
MNGKHFLIQSVGFDSFEGIRSPVADSSLDIVQLAAQPVRGSLLKASLGDFAFGTGQFSGSFRATGPFSQTHVCMGLVLDCIGDVTSFGAEVEVGDIISAPPGGEHHMRFGGPHGFALMSVTPADLSASLAGESGWADDAVSAGTLRFRAEARISAEITRRVVAIAALLKTHGASLSVTATEFWRRAIVEAFVTLVMQGVPPHRAHISSPLKLVREVERYVDARPDAPVHISEICSVQQVSRRTLHRSFYDAVGIGPVAFFRHKRLCAAHVALKNADPSRTRVSDIAVEFGFSEMGRFAGHYQSMFGESPSATLRKSVFNI